LSLHHDHYARQSALGTEYPHGHAKGDYSLFRRGSAKIRTSSTAQEPKSEFLVLPATNISMATLTAKSATFNSSALIESNTKLSKR